MVLISVRGLVQLISELLDGLLVAAQRLMPRPHRAPDRNVERNTAVINPGQKFGGGPRHLLGQVGQDVARLVTGPVAVVDDLQVSGDHEVFGEAGPLLVGQIRGAALVEDQGTERGPADDISNVAAIRAGRAVREVGVAGLEVATQPHLF
ncbi:Uncharacterised protein [Mycobacteroides abscessus subsp. abscessus]|nr:Uncharacterised protein [Mycobacteroides abscessus subsp. abscessus]